MIEINRHPDERTLRQFGALLLPAALVLAGVLLLRRGAPLAAAAAPWAAAAAVAPIGLLRPRLLRPVFVGALYATFPLGWLVSHLVLLLIFCLCVVPLGLLGRLLGRDRLQRRLDRSAATYWHERRRGEDPARYFRQF